MQMKYYLAIDIGASSGRHVLSHLENEKLICDEIYRFHNGMIKKDGQLCWDIEKLFAEILNGMKLCKEIGKIPISVGIDTWGVDFALINENGEAVGNVVAYRDKRTNDIDKYVYEKISAEDLYSKTGIQKQLFNTVYQLMALKKSQPEIINNVKKLLLIPDYLHYLLCGVGKTEYTNATTTGLVNAITKNWDLSILNYCGYPQNIFTEIVLPGTLLGQLLPSIKEQVGYDCNVVVPATHDTGSAVVAVPSTDEDTLYISSGTWSLMGVERLEPDCSLEYPNRTFTNEGGYDYRYRYLKNIMGLWMIQEVKRELDNKHSFSELCEMAKKSTIKSIVNCNDSRFLSPSSMTEEIKEECKRSRQEIPVEVGDIAAVVYNSLATCYRDTVLELESITGKVYPAIYIVGGGSNADYLNKLTAEYTKKKVYAGPSEATAIGNALVQMIAHGDIENLTQAREYVKKSFDIIKY